MEKLSLYSLLSVLLPGALLTLFIEVVATDYGFNTETIIQSQYFKLTLFLSSAIFLGAIIHILTGKLSKLYRKIGLFTSLLNIYKVSNHLRQIRYYIDAKMNNIDKRHLVKDTEHERMEFIWSEMYYELEATDRIKTSKSFQSFYFLFRNFFTLGILLTGILIVLNICYWQSSKYLLLIGLNFLGMLMSYVAGKSYRKRMVERLFWIYYSLNNKQ